MLAQSGTGPTHLTPDFTGSCWSRQPFYGGYAAQLLLTDSVLDEVPPRPRVPECGHRDDDDVRTQTAGGRVIEASTGSVPARKFSITTSLILTSSSRTALLSACRMSGVMPYLLWCRMLNQPERFHGSGPRSPSGMMPEPTIIR